MKLQRNTFTLFLLTVASCNGFSNMASRGTAMMPPNTITPSAMRRPFLLAKNNDVMEDRATNSEVERLRTMAKQLREEASNLASEQARKVAEATRKSFNKFDINHDGTISIDELRIGLQKSLKSDIPESRIEKLIKRFDRNGDGVLQIEEFVAVDKMKNQLDSIIREETTMAIEQVKREQKNKEVQQLLEMQMAIINDGEPTTKDKLVSILPYLFPLIDSLQFAGFFVAKHPENVIAQIAAVMYTIYRSIPLGGFLAFFALNVLATNVSLNKLVRFNISQAILMDIALIVPGFLAFLYSSLATNTSLNLPTEILEYGSDAVLIGMLASVIYASGTSLLGKSPDKLPIVSDVVKDNLITKEMFDESGQFIRRSSGRKDGEN